MRDKNKEKTIECKREIFKMQNGLKNTMTLFIIL